MDPDKKLRRRYKDLGKAHGLFCQHVDNVLADLVLVQAQHPELPGLAARLGAALQAAKRSHQPGPGSALPVAPQGSSTAGGATTPKASPRTGRLPPVSGGFGAPDTGLPPPERLLAALQRARSALVTRQAQLAACRACGAEAAAYEQAAADVEALMRVVAQL